MNSPDELRHPPYGEHMNTTSETSITASISFHFRGQHFTPCIRVDLHDFILKKQQITHLYDLLGASIGLDAYRHEYDVMVLEDIIFSEPTGLACCFHHNSSLDFDSLNKAWQQQQIIAAIQPIAQQHLNISDISEHPDIQKALIASYNAGQKRTEARPVHSTHQRMNSTE